MYNVEIYLHEKRKSNAIPVIVIEYSNSTQSIVDELVRSLTLPVYHIELNFFFLNLK